MKERLASARSALASLEELVVLPQPTKVERDAAIQRFEYTCEATWKTVQLGDRGRGLPNQVGRSQSP